jgi:hypothetical protein
MAFAPKRDWWLSMIIWSCVVLMFFSAISPFVIDGAGTLLTIFIVALCLPCAVLILWVWVISSTATSIHRLEIHYKAYDMIYISPLHQDAFIAELQRRCPQLKLD